MLESNGKWEVRGDRSVDEGVEGVDVIL